MTMTTTPPPGVLGSLARQEIRNYVRSKLFWFGTVLWLLICVVSLRGSDATYSTTGDGLMVALAVGVFGIIIMAGLVRGSDRAAAASGTVAVPERTRTLALAAATVVPAAMGLIWFACALIGYEVNPPGPAAAPFGDHSTIDFYAAMFAEGVTPTIGGPLLGLVIGRWLPGRGAAPLIAVGVVIVTVVMQPLFDWADKPRLGWIWIHFYAPGGVDGDPERMLAYSGSPYLYVGYQLALCALAVLFAMYHDREADRTAMRRTIAGVGAVALVLLALGLVVGTDGPEVSPVPSPGASASATV